MQAAAKYKQAAQGHAQSVTLKRKLEEYVSGKHKCDTSLVLLMHMYVKVLSSIA
jgi:hypothetical protein